MREKDPVKKWNKDRLRLLAVMGFFLLSGIWYSHGFQNEKFIMGEELPVEQVGLYEEPAISAEVLGKININEADAAELMYLDGIGEKLAAEIMAYREENGAFRRIEDIMEVSGIGEKTFEEIKEKITVGEQEG